MPEGLEAEIWRRACAPLVGRTIVEAVVDQRVAPDGFADQVTGALIEGVRRRGKVVLLDTDRATIGLHFGMTGRLVVDGVAAIDQLSYASGRDDPSWDRLVLYATPGGVSVPPAVRFNDPRRLGRISLDPDLDQLGVEFDEVTPERLGAALADRRGMLKPTLLDQHVVAGLGNLCTDEVLWWAALDPRRRADLLSDDEVVSLATAIRTQLPAMLARGGSTHGVLSPLVRSACPPCERDGAPLERCTIGGRTTVWCPAHQR